MNAQELETAERVGAPFITVVLEDGSYSLIKLAQENRKLEPYRMDFRPIDTVKMAEACGVEAVRTSNPDELAAAVKRAVDEEQEPGRRAFRCTTPTIESYSDAPSFRSAHDPQRHVSESRVRLADVRVLE